MAEIKPWHERPVEVANLLNPAFSALILALVVRAYQKESKKALPFPLLFLVLPIVLPRNVRRLRPKTTATRLHSWIQNHPEIRIKFAQRARSLVAYTREALLFGTKDGTLEMTSVGTLTAARRVDSARLKDGSDGQECRLFATQLGTLLARAGDVETIFSMFGVRP